MQLQGDSRIKELERLCNDFYQGVNDSDERYIALVKWIGQVATGCIRADESTIREVIRDFSLSTRFDFQLNYIEFKLIQLIKSRNTPSSKFNVQYSIEVTTDSSKGWESSTIIPTNYDGLQVVINPPVHRSLKLNLTNYILTTDFYGMTRCEIAEQVLLKLLSLHGH